MLPTKRILFVCTGNICRSPMAEAILRKMIKAHSKNWEVDSAATGSWHIGAPPDERATHVATLHGYPTTGMTARQINTADFLQFDEIYAMAKEHVLFLQRLKPKESSAQIFLFLEETLGLSEDVADPYYGGELGFEKMLICLEKGCLELISKKS